MEFIDLKQQYREYRAEIDERIRQVIESAHFIMGPEIAELEEALARYVGVKHCLTVASGTDSLEIALRALEIGPGDEVVTVPFTWISTAEVIGLVGAKPVFVDIDPATSTSTWTSWRRPSHRGPRRSCPSACSARCRTTTASTPLPRSTGWSVIEDGAQSFGATQGGRRSCGVTLIASTSFFPAKPLGCFGDGGALFTSDDALADKMRAIRSHGGLQRHHHPLLGMNGRFDTLQAAVLLAKLPHFDWEVRAAQRHRRALYRTCCAASSTCRK